MNKRIILIGHRGTLFKFDENTLEAFKKAIKFGAEYIEFDIRKTADNILVIFHDSKLKRTTNCSGRVRELTYNEIRKLKTRNRKKSIPTLKDVLISLKNKTKFMIDLKGESVLEKTLKIVKKQGLIHQCIFSGRNLLELGTIKKRFPDCKICYNITNGRDIKLEQFLNLGEFNKLPVIPDIVSLSSRLIDSEFIKICHRNEILAFTWHFTPYENPLEKIKGLIELGIDGILFDNLKNIKLFKKWNKEL